MKVAHICIVTPGRCGLYETTRELVVALRKQGVDSRLIDIPDANKVYPKGYPVNEDRGAPVDNFDWAVTADVIVNHSGYDGTPVAKTDQPIVHVAHGRPRSSFLSEVNGGTPIYTYHYNKNYDPRWKAVVTFWPEHKPYLEAMMPDKPVHVVAAPVDLDYWSPGDRGYDFHGNKGTINVVCADPKREDNDSFLPMMAFLTWAGDRSDARFHTFGAPENMKGYDVILKRIRKNDQLGVIHRWSKKLRNAYRAADFVVTSNSIDTRTVREAMACGCPVLKITGENLSGVKAGFDSILVQNRAQVRAEAVQLFNPENTAAQFKRVLEC